MQVSVYSIKNLNSVHISIMQIHVKLTCAFQECTYFNDANRCEIDVCIGTNIVFMNCLSNQCQL